MGDKVGLSLRIGK